jgi:leucyl aminopeptidase
MRLIELSEDKRVWMSIEEVEKWLKTKECHAGTGFMDITDHPNLKPEENVHFMNRQSGLSSINYQIRHVSLVNNTYIPALSADDLRNSIVFLSSYETRYYTSDTGVQAAEWIQSQFQAVAAQYGRSDITVSLFDHVWAQPSVVARIQGATNGDEVVVIGAHEDSTTQAIFNKKAPGADDDASGTSTVLEVFRALVSAGFVPDRTIEFHTYAAEEVGLRGSQAIAASYANSGVNVVAMMQLDMTGYIGSQEVFGLITDYVDPSLTNFVAELANVYSDLPVSRSTCGYACSDHASWYKAGYPSSFPFEAAFGDDNPDIHSAQDTIDKLSIPHAMEFAKVAVGFAVELGLTD